MLDSASFLAVERLFAGVGVGLVRTRADGRIASVNAAFAEMLGRTAAAPVGDDLRALMRPDGDAPDGGPSPEPLPSAGGLHAEEEDKSARERLHRFAHRDGHEVWGRVSTADLPGPDGGPADTLTVVEDVTALVEAEERARMREAELRFVSDTMAQMIWITEADGHHRYFNRQWYAFTGLPEGSTDGWGWADVLHPDDYGRSIERWRHSLETGEHYEIEYRFRRHDGVYRWQIGRANPHLGADGTIEMWVGTCTDIHDAREAADEHCRLVGELATEREALRTLATTLEARVAERTRALERSNGELQAFAYVASHDLQEPLRKILSYADLVRHDAPPEALGADALDSLDRLQGAAHRMSQLIRDLLSLSLVTTRGDRFAPTDLGVVLDGVLSDLDLVIAETDARIDAAPLPTIDADATQMRQVFQNLIQNALKYRRPGVPPVVRITAEPTGDDCVTLTVADNGTGFDPKQAERIFAPFQRLVGRRIEGSGIGLSIVRRIAERHGGGAAATGRPGDGAAFRVVLPLRHRATEG